MTLEMPLLWAGVVLYTLAGSLAIGAVLFRREPARLFLALLVAGLAAHAVSIGLRWVRLGHGPFITMFEILSSNVWSLLAIFAVAYWRIRAVRPMAAVVMPVLFLMLAWLVLQDPRDTQLPPTYRTVWLYIHVGFGKVFLGAVLVAVGLAGIVLARLTRRGAAWFERLPTDVQLDELAYRFLALGFVFETLMLIAGAIWAQNAWGRYWAWDPLETWAFLTWLMLAFALHLRFTLRPAPALSAAMTLAVFVLAFLTFFGVPFVTTAPHQGAI
jgi:cytochrome c-type biogenesis protein CcsB